MTRYLPPILLLATLCACSRAHERSEVEAAMKRYDRLIMKIDADSIALLYAPDGELGAVAHGRDSIRRFLSSFKNISVLSQNSTTRSLDLAGDSALQKGSYRQVAIINGTDTVTVSGDYESHWVWIPPSGWHIQRMVTIPNQQR